MRQGGWRTQRDFFVGVLLGLLIIGSLVLVAGCRLSTSTAAEPSGTEYVVFLDLSQSIRVDDRTILKQALTDQIVPTLEAGDRLLIASITDRTLTGFHPLVDATLPPIPGFSGWTDNLMTHKKQVKAIETQIPKIKEEINTQIEAIFARRDASAQTDILSSLLLAEKLFHRVTQRKVLVLMSDMIEDYEPYRFQKISWTPDATGKLIDELDNKGLIPNLSGVCVYVAGASASSPMQAEQIAGFWKAYFTRAKADMDMSRYAHVLLHWPPAQACR